MDNRPPLSPRQRDTLDLIKRYLAEKGYSPSLRELANSMGIRSTNGVADHVRALEKKGYIEKTKGRARSIRVVDRAPGGDGELLRRLRAEIEQARGRARLWERRARDAGWSETRVGA